MKIKKMTTGDWNKVKAYFSVETDDGLIVTGFKIIHGINGHFVSMPSEKKKDGEYKDTVMATKDVRNELNDLAVNHYKCETVGNSPDQGKISQGQQNTENVKSFNDDSLPF